MSSLSGISSSGLNFTGLSTGIDTQKLVDGLTKINLSRIDTLKAQQSTIADKQAKFAQLQGLLFDLQSKANVLGRSAGSAFDIRKATSSDDTSVTVAAGTAAIPGTYNITVAALAKSNQIASAGFADPNATIKTGTLTLQVGTGTATTVTIGNQNNTLQGLADAVNAAGGDVYASIINDGTGGSPYRLLISSSKTGAANTIAVTNNLTVGTGAAIDPANTVVQAAADAQVSLGSGLTVSSATNQINNLIPGTTLNLVKADITKSIQIAIKADTDGVVKSAQDFVDSYNAVQNFIVDQTQYNASTQTAGALLGNRDVANLANDLASSLTATVPGTSAGANRLSSVGLSIGEKGKLTLNSSKLNQALSGQSGVVLGDLKKLFAIAGSSDNPGVSYNIATNKTKPSGAVPYQVQIDVAATQAVVVSAGPPGGTVTISPSNNILQIKLNGLLAAGITLDSGTYSVSDLASLIQRKFNSAPTLNGNLITAGVTIDGKLSIGTQAYGSAAKIEITGGGSGSFLADVGFTANQSASGRDVAGRFTVNGLTETATGAGQILTGATGNKNTDGLQVKASITTSGSANVTVNQGLASRLSSTLNKYLDPVNGRLKSVNDAFTKSSAEIDKTVSRQKTLLQAKTEELQLKFAAMESAVSKLKNVGTSLSSLLPASSSK